MAQAYVGQKRVRRYYGKIREVLEMPNLIEVQKSSYDLFLRSGEGDKPRFGKPSAREKPREKTWDRPQEKAERRPAGADFSGKPALRSERKAPSPWGGRSAAKPVGKSAGKTFGKK